MVKRSTPRRILDERSFPVRVAFAHQEGGREISWADASVWLRENIGPGNYALHGLTSHSPFAIAIYFLSVADAARFVTAHPQYRLADGTGMILHLREMREWAASGQGPSQPHSIGGGWSG